VKSFQGNELERYFHNVVSGSPALILRLNQYDTRAFFPHNPVFVRNSFSVRMKRRHPRSAAWEALLRQHWFEETALRNKFFEYLSRTGKLESELTAFARAHPIPRVGKGSRCRRFLAYASLWRSHFEEARRC